MMRVTWINRQNLLRQLQRVAQRKALIVMGSALATLFLFALVSPLIEAFIGQDLIGFAFAIAFFGVPLVLDFVMVRWYCHDAVVCPNCNHTLWGCGSGNFKPRKMRLRADALECPSCHTPIR